MEDSVQGVLETWEPQGPIAVPSPGEKGSLSYLADASLRGGGRRLGLGKGGASKKKKFLKDTPG